jgi:cytochrome c peroxidase
VRRAAAAAALALSACAAEPAPAWEWGLPEGFPPPRVPDDNPMSEAKFQLGRRLFHDVRLSANETQACATCHRQELAFTDGRAAAIGSTGQTTQRGAMSVANAGYPIHLGWANLAVGTLEDQALVPLFGEDPVELGMAGREGELLERLRRDALYPAMFADAFPGEPEPITLRNLLRAIACFERGLVSAGSPYDRWSYGGDARAMSPAAIRGHDLFFGDRFRCFHCHGGFLFTEGGHHNSALYDVDGEGAYPAEDRGLIEHTSDPADMGRFRVPSLRNVALTAPYMHDGSVATLEEALDHYQAGGRTITSGPNAGVGSASPLRDPAMMPFDATAEERSDLIEFLRALTDREFVESPRFASPFASP